MNNRVLVRGSMRTWDLTLLIVIGIVLFIVAAIMALTETWILAVLAVLVSGGLLLGGLLGWQGRIRQRRWVEDTGNGFVVVDCTGERRIQDGQVLATSLTQKGQYVNGLLKCSTRCFIVWLADGDQDSERLEMTNTIPLNGRDPLQDLIKRISERLYAQAQQDLQAGRGVLGEGWTLLAQALEVKHVGGPERCPFEEVTAVDYVDDNLCIWRRGMDEAWAKIKVASANAHLLARLLAERKVGHCTTETPAQGGLGRIIFERKPSRSLVVFCNVASMGFLIGAGVLAIVVLISDAGIGLSLLCAVGGLALAAAIYLGGLACASISLSVS